jgi:hypothetical protein
MFQKRYLRRLSSLRRSRLPRSSSDRSTTCAQQCRSFGTKASSKFVPLAAATSFSADVMASRHGFNPSSKRAYTAVRRSGPSRSQARGGVHAVAPDRASRTELPSISSASRSSCPPCRLARRCIGLAVAGNAPTLPTALVGRANPRRFQGGRCYRAGTGVLLRSRDKGSSGHSEGAHD